MSEKKKPVFCSQHGEDILLAKVFEGQKEGYYVELGSHDGLHLSNTHYFEQIGWTGLLVEAHSGLVDTLRSNRQGSICIQAAVSENEGELIFYETPYGSLSTFDLKQRDYFIKRRSEVTLQSYRETKVRTAGTTTLLDEAKAPQTIDFMSVDIEGAELAALKSFDFSKYNVRIFIVELERKQKEADRAVSELLLAQGYRVARTVGVNAFWVKEKDLGERVHGLPIEGEVHHFRNINGKVTSETVRVFLAAGKDTGKRSLVLRLRQSISKRYHKYLKKAA